MTTVHASPDYRITVVGSPPPGYPSDTAPDVYADRPFAADFEARKAAFLQHCLSNPAPTNTKGAYHELARLEAGGIPHEGVIRATLDFIDQRKDCADFSMHAILRMLLQYGDHPTLSPELLDQARRTVLDFKYWPDEPGIDSLCTWTENHQILFASAAYLAGQEYPDQRFSNSGHTGTEKMELNQPRIMRWLDLRFRTGFSEWLSNVYYDEDLTALLSLVDFADDEEIRQRASMLLDLLLLDVALNSFKGVFGSTHGRSYENSKKWVAQEGLVDTSKLLFGMGQFSDFDNMSAAAFVLSPKYKMPDVIPAIAGSEEHEEMINRQRMGIRLDEAERWGLGFDSFEDGMTYLTLEAYAHPRTIGLVMRMFDAFKWWENSFFSPFKQFKGFLTLLRRTHTLRLIARLFERDLCRNTREEVNTYTFRTPDYMLSSAQEYRPGYGGDQQSIWQATLGPNAVCFTTHPAKRVGPSPNYWTGSGTLPRAAQVKNVVICIYRISRGLALYQPNRLFLTHAWLPRDKFDEVVERSGWIFARLGEGYLALYSKRPYHWQTNPGEDRDREVIAPGRENIWICEMGRKASDGNFKSFIERIANADVSCRGLNVRYNSPSQGMLEFGWKGQLLQNGSPISTQDYPRYENPFIEAPFPARELNVLAGSHALSLDWDSATREVGDAR
jgi:hypothetical protein